MYRYLALIWNPADPTATTVATRHAETLRGFGAWTQAFAADNLVVFESGASRSSETRRIGGERGVVCGTVFPSEPVELDATDQEAFNRQAAEIARVMLARFWGRYVAIHRDRVRGEVSVLRDPTGMLPCFVTSRDGVSLVFSDIEACLALGFKFTIDWQYIAAYVPYSALQIRSTGLNEVTEVQPGEQIVFGKTLERRLLWSPLGRDLIEDPAVAISRVRETVRHCVQAWASKHASIVHNLSGGLDSSIVLSCLKGVPKLTCLHYFAPASGEDERRFARLAAAHFGAELVECALDPAALNLRQLLHIRYTPRPWFYIYDLEQGPLEARVAAEHGATAVFSGSSGDGLFVQARAELAVADYLRRHGIGPGVLRVALNAARINRQSVWPILRQGFARHLKRPVRSGALSQLDDVRTLVPREVFAAARDNDELIHPWLRDVRDIPPGLRWHILCVSIPPAFYNSFDAAEVERTPVLFSQPLIELCLSIPSYVWISGGRDRSIVRAAFAADLPPAIVRRTQKGAIDRHNRKLMDENETFLREMLLDGQLVGAGLLDRQRLEQFLGRGATPLGFEYNEVLRQHLCTEMWLRRWAAPTSSCAR